MAKITLIMDFISGLLLAYDFLPKSGRLLQFHNSLRKSLEKIDTNDPTSKGTIFFNIIVSCFMFLILLCYAYYKTKNVPDTHIGAELISYFVGIVIALIVLMVLTKIIRKRYLMFTCGMILAIVTLVFIAKLHPSIYVIAASIASIYMFIFFPLAMISANYIKKGLLAHPEKEYYIFAVLGLVLFVASNLIAIIVDP